MTRTTDSRLPAGTIPGIIILAILAALAVAMLRSGSTTPTDAGAGSVARDQPDYSYAERREPDDPFALGPVDAPVGLVVFSDYQCPFCAQWNHETMPVMEQFANDGDLRIEWRDVNVYGPAAERAALAAVAAARQGSYWEYHDALFQGGRTRPDRDLSQEALIELAGDLGLDRERFAADMDSTAATDEIARNEELGMDHGATATPVFILGGVPHVGAQPPEVFAEAFQDALRQSGG